VVAKYLRVARPRYKQLIISIETLLDFSQLSIEEVTGRLKAADDVKPSPPQNANGKLLLTEEQWIEKYKKGQESSRGGSSSGGRSRGQGRGRGRSSGEPRPPPDSPPARAVARKATGPATVAARRRRSRPIRPMWPRRRRSTP
jgi:hypothetical protein